MRNHELNLAPDNGSESIIMKEERKIDNMCFTLEGVRLVPTKTAKYLGVMVDVRVSFGPHVMMVVIKAEKKTANLTRIVPTVNGPRSYKWVTLRSELDNMLQYAAPVWHKAVDIQKYRKIMERMSSYNTASMVAIQVVAGTTPSELMVLERTYIFNYSQEDRSHTIKSAKEEILVEWQKRWDDEIDRA